MTRWGVFRGSFEPIIGLDDWVIGSFVFWVGFTWGFSISGIWEL